MTETENLPPLEPVAPCARPPAGAIDCHAHIIGPLDRFPVTENRSYDVFDTPADRYLEMLDALGLTGGVVVTASAYGTDNRAIEHALATHPDRLRGIAVVDDHTTVEELARLTAAGVRGLRFTQLSNLVPEFRGTVGYDALKTLAPAMRELGLHAQIWTLCDLFAEQHRELLNLGIRLVLDHMGLFDPTRGTADPAFQTLLALLDNDDDVWIKLIPYRMSSRYPDYDDLRPFHEAMLATNPDKLVWGSDWPHVHMSQNMPSDAHLLDLCLEWTGDNELAHKLLVENPARLYGFRAS